MNNCAILLVCSALAAASSLATCKMSFVLRYLDWTRLPLSYSQNRMSTYTNLVNIGCTPQDNVQMIGIKIFNAFENPEYASGHAVFKDLMNLSSKNYPCTDDIINRTLDIYSLLRDLEDDSLDSFVPFLNHYARLKFGKCSWDFVSDLNEGDGVNERAEKQLSIFLDETMSASEKNSDDQLRALYSLDFSHPRFRRMFDIKKSEFLRPILELSDGLEGRIESVFNFLNSVCTDLVKGRERALDIITLADASGYLGHSGEGARDSLKVEKLKEYHRLCLSLRRADMKAKVNANLVEHITNRLSEDSD